MTTVAVRQQAAIARPLKVLVPLIKLNLRRGDEAGMEYYVRAGGELREARPQVAAHRWSAWLTLNVGVSKKTAWRYMRASEIAENADEHGNRVGADTLEAIAGEEPRAERHRKAKRRAARAQATIDALADVDVDYLAVARATRDEETRLHRELAMEFIDIAYKALATRLHPDRGGSKDAMRRLNRIRDEFKSVAETRRFE